MVSPARTLDSLAEDPLTCVVRGAGKVLGDMDLLRQVTIM